MGYVKQTFIDNKTTLKAEHLNHIEDGIAALETAIENLGGSVPDVEGVGTTYPFSMTGYLGAGGALISSNNTGTTDYIDITSAKSVYYHGRMGYVAGSEFYAIGFYDANKNFLADISVMGTGSVMTTYIKLTEEYKNAAYVRGSWSKGSVSDAEVAEFLFMLNGKPASKKKTFAVLCDSIGTHGNTGDYHNVPEIEVTEADIGKTLSAYLTYYDVHDAGEQSTSVGPAINFTIGGQTFTEQNNGQEITFVPTADDIGKKVGKVYDWNGNNLKTWWLWLAEAYNLEPIPVCWASSAISSHESGTSNPTDGLGGGRVKNAYAWHESQVRKCGIRTPGTMNRTAPDYIIIARGTNDWSHASGTTITKDYFDSPESWEYPTTDKVGSYYGIKEAISMTVKNMRTAYPKAKIFLCTIPYNTRGNKTTFPRSFGGKSYVSFNRAVRECAEFFGCGLIDFAGCGVTHENVGTYTTDGVHLNAKGHELAGRKAIVDFANYETDLIWE